MIGLLYIILGFLAAEGAYSFITGRSFIGRNRGRKELYEDLEERAKKVRTTMDRMRDRNRLSHHAKARELGSGKEVLRVLPSRRVPRN